MYFNVMFEVERESLTNENMKHNLTFFMKNDEISFCAER
jgi:hypothetical protein